MTTKMYYDAYRVYQPQEESIGCVSLQTAGKIIGIIEILFHFLIYFPLEEKFKLEQEKVIIVTVLLGVLVVFGMSLLYGSFKNDALYITPWLWIKYGIIIVQVVRFVFFIVGLSIEPDMKAGSSLFFEFLYFAYNTFTISIIREYVSEIEEVPLTVKQFYYYRV